MAYPMPTIGIVRRPGAKEAEPEDSLDFNLGILLDIKLMGGDA